MAETTAPLDKATRTALEGLSDIVLPPPVSWMPHTTAWIVLAAILLLLLGWFALRWRHRYLANRYRREALAELVDIEAHINTRGAQSIVAMTALMKRVALAIWPRETIAALSGPEWVAFLRQKSGPNGVPDPIAAILDNHEYREPVRIDAAEATAFARALRLWTEGHRVST